MYEKYRILVGRMKINRYLCIIKRFCIDLKYSKDNDDVYIRLLHDGGPRAGYGPSDGGD